MQNETKQLLDEITNSSITNFFKRRISSFKVESEDLQYIVPDKGYESFLELRKHGEVEYTDGDELLVFSSRYDGQLSARSSKKKQYEIAKKILKEDFKDGAIFIFYDDMGSKH